MLPMLLTVDEAADLLRTTRRAIYAMIERRQLPGVIRIRRRVLLRADELVHWLDQKRAPSPSRVMAMSVKVRAYRRGGWEVDITIRLPNGWRERSKAPVSSKTAAQRWGEDRERHVLQHGLPEPKKEVPTLEQFAPRFLDGHARANRQKPSGIVSKTLDVNAYLIVLLGGEAGLRCGEIIALEWSDVDLGKRQLCVQRSEWRGPRHGSEGRTASIRAVDSSTGNCAT
ncbi:MAG: helix-turn-helix domain-containing protein [Acidobacteria bacterium]|nr:helix-turn-helix domain-containing protein [Acidobacteriota bacterium]